MFNPKNLKIYINEIYVAISTLLWKFPYIPEYIEKKINIQCGLTIFIAILRKSRLFNFQALPELIYVLYVDAAYHGLDERFYKQHQQVNSRQFEEQYPYKTEVIRGALDARIFLPSIIIALYKNIIPPKQIHILGIS